MVLYSCNTVWRFLSDTTCTGCSIIKRVGMCLTNVQCYVQALFLASRFHGQTWGVEKTLHNNWWDNLSERSCSATVTFTLKLCGAWLFIIKSIFSNSILVSTALAAKRICRVVSFKWARLVLFSETIFIVGGALYFSLTMVPCAVHEPAPCVFDPSSELVTIALPSEDIISLIITFKCHAFSTHSCISNALYISLFLFRSIQFYHIFFTLI